jgi:hypothetical protein
MARPIRIAFGKHRASGEILHISAVPRGLACDCDCVGCGAPLVARRGPILGAHFAHYGVIPCVNAPETALHAWAKAVIAQTLRVTLPSHSERIDGRKVELLRRTVYHFDDIALEVNLGVVRPDVLAVRTGKQLAIEIKVTHACSAEKIQYFIEQDISAIEIDLSDVPRDAAPEDLADAVINTAPRIWLHNRKLSDLRYRAIERIEAQQATKAAGYPIPYRGGYWGDTAEAAGYNVAQAAKESLRRLESGDPDHDPHGHRACLNSLGLESLLSGDRLGAGAFKVLPKVWQAAVIWDFLLNGGGHRMRGGFTERDCIDKLLSRNMAQQQMCEFIHPTVEAISTGQKHPFIPPYRSMRSFAIHLETQGAVAKLQGNWIPNLPSRFAQEARIWHQANYGRFQFPP